MTLAPPHRREGPLHAVKSVLEIVVVAIFVTSFIVQPFRIPSGSMTPTLKVGDFLLVDKQTFAPGAGRFGILPKSSVHRGDIIVFHWPVDPTLHLVKRVIALPGDRIRLHHGHVLLNGQPLDEPYAFYSPSRPNPFRDEFPSLREADPNVEPLWWITLRNSIANHELTIPPGQYFVLGDNRNDSEDSRYWGLVPRSNIVGRPLLVYFTLNPNPDLPPHATLLTRLRSALHYGLTSARILR